MRLPGLIDPRPPFNTRETWEQHLAKLNELPSNTLGRDLMMAQAKRVLAQNRRES